MTQDLLDGGSSLSRRIPASSIFRSQRKGTSGARGEENAAIVVGVLPGEGIGPEVISGALEVLTRVAQVSSLPVKIRKGGKIGRHAEVESGAPLSAEVIEFCADIFAQGGAILSGPGGGRYVYDMRKHFDLFFKKSPIKIENGLPDASRLKLDALAGVDILITRENSGGIYQGTWNEGNEPRAGRVTHHHVEYSESQVRRFLLESAAVAHGRNGNLTVVWKESGVPSISALWRDCAFDAAEAFGIRCRMIDVDLMAYRLIHDAPAFDVIAAPNLFGDVLADLAAVLLGSRGVSFSGNYASGGAAVFQTNHGAAYDLAGTDRANPVGQIFSMAMMLRDAFGRRLEADAIEDAVRSVWRDGCRTPDALGVGTCVVGTREMSRRIAERAAQIVRDRSHSHYHRSRVA
jgi:3-isopropylmalate dehydrogenase